LERGLSVEKRGEFRILAVLVYTSNASVVLVAATPLAGYEMGRAPRGLFIGVR
jgi:hypothetical protein